MPAPGQRSPDGLSIWNGTDWETGTATGQPVLRADPSVSAVASASILPLTDDPGHSIGAQIMEAVQARAASGLPFDEAWSTGLWQRAGLTPEQAKLVHNYVRTWQQTSGKAAGESDLNEVLGQVKAGQVPDASKWSSTIRGAGAAPVPTPAPGTPAAPAAPAAPGPATPGNIAPGMDRSANHFIGADSTSHLNDLILNNKGDFGVLAQRLLKNQEDYQGGRFNEPIRGTFERKGQNLEGLLGLEAARNAAFTDQGGAVADTFQAGLGAGSQYDAPAAGYGKKLLNDTLDYAKAHKATLGADNAAAAGLFSKGGISQQLAGLRSALGIDTAATLSGANDARVDEEYKNYLGLHAGDPAASSDFGSFLEYAKTRGLF